MSWQVTARGPSRGKPAAVVLTPDGGAPVALSYDEASQLFHSLHRALLQVDRTERHKALAEKVQSAKRRERQAAKAAEGEG